MARARNIKPAFFQNEELAELKPIERLAFIALWTVCDFKGCLEYRSKRLKIQLLPYDNCDIESIINNLNKSGFIRIYSVQGQQYIKIINFEKHQNPHKNERDSGSDIPDIDESYSKINELNKDGISTDFIGSTLADSLLLIPDTLKPISAKNTYSEDFEIFWSAYPKKKDKVKAFAAWKKYKPRIDDVMYALSWQKESDEWLKEDGKYIKYPERYISHGSWQDEEPVNTNKRKLDDWLNEDDTGSFGSIKTIDVEGVPF